MWIGILTREEHDFTEKAICELKKIDWARSLIDRLNDRGGLQNRNLSLLFEVRFAYAIHKSGYIAEYEYKTGIGDSSVDFRIKSKDKEWLIELVSIQESNAVKNSTTTRTLTDGIEESSMILSTDADDRRQSDEGELLKVQEKIGEKVFSENRPIKFPDLKENTYHIIFVDTRGFCGGVPPDRHHLRQIVLGSKRMKPEYISYWKNNQGQLEPIKGLFEGNNPLKAASAARKRIHFLGFIAEENFNDTEILEKAIYLPNPELFCEKKDLQIVWDAYPLKKN